MATQELAFTQPSPEVSRSSHTAQGNLFERIQTAHPVIIAKAYKIAPELVKLGTLYGTTLPAVSTLMNTLTTLFTEMRSLGPFGTPKVSHPTGEAFNKSSDVDWAAVEAVSSGRNDHHPDAVGEAGLSRQWDAEVAETARQKRSAGRGDPLIALEGLGRYLANGRNNHG